MKIVAILAAAGLVLASASAYAQMHQGPGGQMHQGHGDTATRGEMHRGGMDHGRMHGGMMHRRGMAGGMGHAAQSGSHAMQPKGDAGPSSLAFHGINAKMHGAMDIAFTGNADADFVRGMIPHHQGALDMAKTVLAFGTDPEVRKLAEGIVKAQEGEIALMRDWLKRNGQ
jgi:uncharacterized protein (DUF305 family)